MEAGDSNVISPEETTNGNNFDGNAEEITHGSSNGAETSSGWAYNEEPVKTAKRRGVELKKQLKDSKHDNQRLLHEKEELLRQLRTIKQQYESKALNNKNVEKLLKNKEIMRIGEAEAMRDVVSRGLHHLNKMEEEKLLSLNSNENKNWNEDTNHAIMRMLQTATTEKATLHANLLTNVDGFRQRILSQLKALKDEVTEFAKQQGKSEEEERWNRENMITQLNEQVRSIESSIKRLREENSSSAKETKDKDKQIKKLKASIEQQEKELALHADKVKKIENDYNTKLKIEKSKNDEIQARIDGLKQNLEQQKTEKQAAAKNQLKLEHEKIQFIQDQSKQMEKDLRTKQAEKIENLKKLAQKDTELRKIMSDLDKDSDIKQKTESEIDLQRTQIASAESEIEKLKQYLKEISTKSIPHADESKKMENELKQLQRSIDQLTKINDDLHTNLRAQGQKEREYKDRENQIIEKEKALNEPKKKVKAKANKPKPEKPRKIDNIVNSARTRPDLKPTWDPLFQYRTLFPFPWLSAILFFLLFLSLMTK